MVVATQDSSGLSGERERSQKVIWVQGRLKHLSKKLTKFGVLPSAWESALGMVAG